MNIDEFNATVGLDGDRLPDAYEIFREELTVPRKTLAHRSADLAGGLRRLGLDEEAVYAAVLTLARERRR